MSHLYQLNLKDKIPKKFMKILIFAPSFIPVVGGTEIAVENIISALKAKEHEVTLVTRYLGDIDRSIERSVHSSVSAVVRLRHFRFFPILLWILTYFWLKNNGTKFDIIHLFHHFHFGLPVTSYYKNRHHNLIYSMMGTDTFDPERKNPLGRFVLRELEKYVISNSNFIVSPSKSLLFHSPYYSFRNIPSKIIPHGVDAIYLTNHDEKSIIDVTRKGRSIVTVSRLDKIKRIPELIQTLTPVLISGKFSLEIIGSGHDLNRISHVIKTNNLEKFVKLRGQLADPIQIHKKLIASSLFISNASYESFGISIAEAIASETPVLITSNCGIADLVNKYRLGFVFSNDGKNMLTALEVISDNNQYSEMIINCRVHRELFDWKMITRRYISIYNSLQVKGKSGVKFY